MSEIKTKLTPIYWFEYGVIALCDKDDTTCCDADQDCSECKNNHLKEIFVQAKKTIDSFHLS